MEVAKFLRNLYLALDEKNPKYIYGENWLQAGLPMILIATPLLYMSYFLLPYVEVGKLAAVFMGFSLVWGIDLIVPESIKIFFEYLRLLHPANRDEEDNAWLTEKQLMIELEKAIATLPEDRQAEYRLRIWGGMRFDHKPRRRGDYPPHRFWKDRKHPTVFVVFGILLSFLPWGIVWFFHWAFNQ